VQAFLDAADEVDIDQDIATDILQGFDGDLNNGEDGEVDVEADGEMSAVADIYVQDSDDDKEDRDWEGGDDEGSSELDAFQEEGEGVLILVAYEWVCTPRICEAHASDAISETFLASELQNEC
jgi:hypothetical protein